MVVVVLQGCHRRGRRLRRCRRRRGRFRRLTDVVAVAATVGVIVVVIVVVGVVGTGGTHHRTGDALVPAAESTAPPPSAGHSTRVRCAFREWEPTRDPVGSDGGWGWEASTRCAPSGAAGASRDVPGRILMVGAPQVVPGVVRGGGDYPGMSLREMVGWPGGRDLCLGGSGGPGTCPGCVWGRGVRGGSSSGKHGRQIRRQFRETRPQ